MAIKGDSADPKKDIFSPPKLSIDTTNRHKPHPSGVRPYLVGTQVAKDLMLGVDEQGGRIKLLGTGPGRMHWPKTVRPDYWDQITAEVKVPHKTIRGRLVWQCQSGRRNEGTDCEVYALHAARSLKLNLWRDERWAAEENALRQPSLGLEDTAPLAVVPTAEAAGADDQPEETQDDAAAGAAPVQTPAQPAAPAAAPAAKPVATRPVGASPKPGMQRTGGWSAKNW